MNYSKHYINSFLNSDDEPNAVACKSIDNATENHMEDEIWLPVNGTDNKYLISSVGRLKVDLNRCQRNKLKDPKSGLVTPKIFGGYVSYCIWVNGEKKNAKGHRLVAQTFIPNPENKPQVNHINGIKTDNRVENLEWVTQSENMRHAIDTGLKKVYYGADASFYGKTASPEAKEKMCAAKLGRPLLQSTKDKIAEINRFRNNKKVVCTTTGTVFHSLAAASEYSGIDKKNLSSMLLGKRNNKTSFKYLNAVQ